MERTLKRQFIDLVGDYYMFNGRYDDGRRGLISKKRGVNFDCGTFNPNTGVVVMNNETDALIIDQLIIEQNKQDLFQVILD